MKTMIFRHKSLIASGSITAAALIMALVPFNMGGCSAGNMDIGGLVQGGTTLAKSASLGDKDEPALGESVALQATNRYPISQDKNLTRYVTLVGRTVGTTSKMPGLNYFFAILDTPEVNAFSGPHGFVFITRGALDRMKDESELAGVLGHEIGHICKQHGLNAMRSAATRQGLSQLAKSEQHVAAFGGAADDVSTAVLNTGFSQPQEQEADAEGVKYITAAGYDPNGYLHFLQRLQAEQGTGGKPFGTHPGIGDRIKRVQTQISSSGAQGGVTLADRFAMNVPAKTN